MPLKLLTWNIQAAIGTARYTDYVMRVHRQVLHTAAKTSTLETIAETIRPLIWSACRKWTWAGAVRGSAVRQMRLPKSPAMRIWLSRRTG